MFYAMAPIKQSIDQLLVERDGIIVKLNNAGLPKPDERAFIEDIYKQYSFRISKLEERFQVALYWETRYNARVKTLDALLAACEKFSAAHCFPSSNKNSAFYAEPPTDAVVDPQDWVEFSEAIKAAKS